MKKQFLSFICWLSLIIPGSGALLTFNAQTAPGIAPVPKIHKNSVQKTAPNRSIVRKRSAGSISKIALGDPCDESVPIAAGQTLDGILSEGDCVLEDGTLIDFYSFQGTAGQSVSISMNSSDFDTFLFLLDAEGEVIAEDDDGGSGVNSRIPGFDGAVVLPLTGTYFIGANALDEGKSGDYSVNLSNRANCAPTPVAFNQRVSRRLTGTGCIININEEFFFKHFFSFEGTAGQTVSLAMDSGTVDAHLVLHTPSGAGQLINDDRNIGTDDARIPAAGGTVTLTQTGTYVIEAGTAESGDTGFYSVLVRDASIPDPAHVRVDFDGDTKTDISIFRPAATEWWTLRSADGENSVIRFGNSTDRLVSADFTGDGLTDLAVWRESTGQWFVFKSEDGSFFAFPFGQAGDTPVPADYDGDGQADAAVFRPSTGTWYVLSSATLETGIFQFGIAEDKPVVADYDGDGKADVAIFRPSTGDWWVRRSTNASVFAFRFGLSADKPVQGDYTGDGKADAAVFRPATGEWFVLRSDDATVNSFSFGQSGDLLTPGDYDGDGRFDPAVFRPDGSSWFVDRTTAGLLITNFGTTGDRPVPGAPVP